MRLEILKEGFINGTPWIGRFPRPCTSCRISNSQNTNYSIDARVCFQEDLGFVPGDDDFNEALFLTLAKKDLQSETAKQLIVVIWVNLDEDENPSLRHDTFIEAQLFVDEIESVAFEAKFQYSSFGLDVDTLNFGECAEKSSHLREFTIQNQTDGKLLYHILAYGVENEADFGGEEKELSLAFYDNGVAIKTGSLLELAGRSFARIHAALKPARRGQRVWMIVVENERNSSNVAKIAVRARVFGNDGVPAAAQGSTPLANTFEVTDLGGRPLPNGAISFGDECYTGIVVTKKILLRNQGASDVAVSLVCPDAVQGLGHVSMIDSTSYPLEFHDNSSESDKEDGASSPRQPSLQASSYMAARIERRRSSDAREGDIIAPDFLFPAHSGEDDVRTVADSADEPRGRSDTLSSTTQFRHSSLASPNLSTIKRRESDQAANGKESTRDRARSQESHASSTPRPAPSRQDVLYDVPPSEVVHIPAGQVKEVWLHYLPSVPANMLAEKTRKLNKQSFRLNFVYNQGNRAKVTRTILAEAKVCVSFITASTSLIKFGDCHINHPRTSSVTFQNHSDVETQVKLVLHSKSLKVEPSLLTIGPRSSAAVNVTITPQSVNPNFSKEITCLNLRNRDNRIVVTVESSNVEMSDAALHAYFYKLVAFDKSGAEVELLPNWPTFFPATLLDSVCVRRIGLRNLTSHNLSLAFKHGEEIQILSPVSDFKDEFEALVTSFETAVLVKSVKSNNVGKRDDDVVESTEKRLQALSQALSLVKVRKVTTARLPPDGFQTFALVFRPQSSRRSGVGGCLVYDGALGLDVEMTEFYSDDMPALQNAYRWTFTDKNLDPAEDMADGVESLSKRTLKRNSVITSSQLSMATIGSGDDTTEGGDSISEFVIAQSAKPMNLPPRRVPLRATVAKSCMKLSQTHFSFGTVRNSWERRHASAIFFNLSAIPLPYRIEKRPTPGASMPSCVDISEEAMTGVVPPFGSETLNFTFIPRTWEGKVKETLILRNVLDNSTCEIIVKADVSIPEHFKVECEDLDFGPCFPGLTTQSPRFLSLTNTTKKNREIVIQVSPTHTKSWPKSHVPVFCFHLFPPRSESAGGEEIGSIMEQCELLEHQIRIATRKSDNEKVALLTRKLAALASQPAESSEDQHVLRGHRLAPIGPLKGSVLVSIPPMSVVRVAMWLHVRLMASSAAFQGYATFSPGLRIYESKQGDQVTKHVHFSCELFSNKLQYLKSTSASPMLGPATLGSPVLPAIRSARSPSASLVLGPNRERIASIEVSTPHKEGGSGNVSKGARQIEVGTQTINEWFTFYMEITCPTMPSAVPSQMPSLASNVSTAFPGAEQHPEADEFYSFRFIRVYPGGTGEDQIGRGVELRLPSEEIVLSPREGKRQIKMEARFVQGGRHYTSLLVFKRSQIGGQETREEIVIKGQASYLLLDPPSLDFGNVIVVPDNFAKRDQPFTLASPIRTTRVSIRNTHTEPVLVSAESNSNQVVVFSAETNEQVNRVLLEPQEIMQVDVSVKPSLLADAWKGMGRSLRGGVIVTCEVGSEDQRDVAHVARFQSSLPFSGVVGMSVFTVTEQRVPGTIRIANRSDRIPLRVEVTSDSEDVRFSPSASTVKIAPASELDMTVRLVSTSTALSFRNISVRNLDTNEVQSFKTACALSVTEVLNIEKGFGVRVAVPVRKGGPKDFVVAHDALSDEPVRIRNISDQRQTVIIRCGYLATGGPIEEQDPPCISGVFLTPIQASRTSVASPGAEARSNGLIARAECTINPGAHKDVYFKFPRDSRLHQGSFRGWLTFELRRGGEDCAAAIKFQGEARVSHFELKTSSKADAGEFGAVNRWEARTVELARVTNSEALVPADVEVSVSSPFNFIRIIPFRSRFPVEPGSVGHTMLGTVHVLESGFRAAFPNACTGMEFESVLTLTNALNSDNTVPLAIALRVCPKRFCIEKDGREVLDDLVLPTVDYQNPTPASTPSTQVKDGETSGAIVVGSSASNASTGAASALTANEWFTVVNNSNVSELVLETGCVIPSNDGGSDFALVLIYRSTGAPLPPTLKLKPGERVNVRVVLRLERGCALRGEDLDFGRVRFATLSQTSLEDETQPAPEQAIIRILGRINGPPLLRAVPEKRWEVLPGEIFAGQIVNDSRAVLRVQISISDSDIACLIEETDSTPQELSSMTLEISAFSGVTISIKGKAHGSTKIKAECIPHKVQGNLQIDLLVPELAPVVSRSDPLSQQQSQSAKSTIEQDEGPGFSFPKSSPRNLGQISGITPASVGQTASPGTATITGATKIHEWGLYEIDAGILNEPRQWVLGGITGEFSLVAYGRRSDSNSWVSAKRISPDSIQIRLVPQSFGETGGFFAAYLCVPGMALIRVKMEVVMRDSDDIVPPIPINPNVQQQNELLPFDVSPTMIVSGPLFLGRVRSFPFTVFNRHAQIPLVFQLTVAGVKDGLQAWFSFHGGEEEHRRVTIMPSSCARLALNLFVPPTQTEDFTDLDINIACRHLRNSRLLLPAKLPARAIQPRFTIDRMVCAPGDKFKILTLADEQAAQTNCILIGPEWISCSVGNDPPLNRPGLIRGIAQVGQEATVVEAVAPGYVTVYNAADPSEWISVKVLSPGLGPPVGGASHWRDAIELELTRVCVQRGEFSACPSEIVFREIAQLLMRDPGGRGASIAALYMRLRFGSDEGKNDSEVETIEAAQLGELKSIPECLSWS